MNNHTLVEDHIEEDINPYADYALNETNNDNEDYELY